MEAASADKMMAQMQDITFVFDGDASALGAAGSAWILPAGATPDVDRIAKLAALLGVEGELREVPADQGGGWMIGAADYSTASLMVSADGMLSWWFNPAPSSAVVDPAVSCVAPGYEVDAAATTEVVGPVTTDGFVVAPPDGSYVECPQPEPPANVPDEATALAKAKQLFADMGYDNSTYEYEVYADEWGANVTAYLLLNGMRSPISLSVGFGADSSVTWASGSLATPVPAGEYPLAGVEGGIVRLNDETGQWGGYWGGPMAMSRMESSAETTEVAAEPASSEVVVPTTGTVLTESVTETTTAGDSTQDAGTVGVTEPGQVGEPISIDSPVCDPAADCGVEMPELEPITVTLTGVKMALTMVWAADNTIWLLPAYSFSADDSGEYTVIAIDDSFIQLPAPYPTDTVPAPSMPIEPLPVDVPADTVLVDDNGGVAEEVGKSIVGLPVEEAVTVAEAAGVIVRVVEGDGAEQTITEDLRPNRLNVSVHDGVVANILSIG